ncbi:MAG: hypothetical protein M0R34_00350 [Candidatus Marinimicrobia bacterium]|jgi:hypothetical protein|nr:hypothetical protein [Candidatus Neomarinimicrobiota bacterium]
MTDKEIEQLVKLTANETADNVIDKAKKEWAKDIKLHALECPAGKKIDVLVEAHEEKKDHKKWLARAVIAQGILFAFYLAKDLWRFIWTVGE